MKQKTKNILFYSLTVFICIYILINPYESIYYCKYALSLCANSVVPSLYTFIVLSKIISGYSCSYSDLSRENILCRIFCLPKVIISTAITGLFFGAPSGAVSLCDIYKKGYCTKNQAEIAVTLCNNCSAAFILTIVSSVLQSTKLSFLLLISNILTTLTVYFLLFRSIQVYSKKSKTIKAPTKKSISEIICSSTTESAVSTISLCGYILLFYTFSGIVCDKFSTLLEGIVSEDTLYGIKALTSLFFEMSSGIIACSNVSGNAGIILCSICVAFCGLSVIFQVTSVLKECGLSSKNYILSKILSAFICPLYMLLFLFIIPDKTISVSNFILLKTSGINTNSFGAILFIFTIFIIATYIISYIDKSDKNKR